MRWLLIGAAGCGYTSSSEGGLGMLTYGLHTDYDGDVDSLRGAPLLTRHAHSLTVTLTADGEEATEGSVEDLVHSAEAGEVQSEDDGFTITVDEPGRVKLESWMGGELFDQIRLRFDDPVRLELVAWVRAPWAEQWVSRPGHAPLTVEEGSQLSLLAIPYNEEGERVLGEFTPEITVDPSLAVPDATVLHVYEEEVWTEEAQATFFVLGPGEAVFTVTDLAHQISVDLPVTITPITP